MPYIIVAFICFIFGLVSYKLYSGRKNLSDNGNGIDSAREHIKDITGNNESITNTITGIKNGIDGAIDKTRTIDEQIKPAFTLLESIRKRNADIDRKSKQQNNN